MIRKIYTFIPLWDDIFSIWQLAILESCRIFVYGQGKKGQMNAVLLYLFAGLFQAQREA